MSEISKSLLKAGIEEGPAAAKAAAAFVADWLSPAGRAAAGKAAGSEGRSVGRMVGALRREPNDENAVMNLLSAFEPDMSGAVKLTEKQLGRRLGEDAVTFRDAVQDTVLGFRNELNTNLALRMQPTRELTKMLGERMETSLADAGKGLLHSAEGPVVVNRGLLRSTADGGSAFGARTPESLLLKREPRDIIEDTALRLRRMRTSDVD